MQPPEALTPATAEQRFVTDGPNSGGIRGWLLHGGHMFSFWQDFSSGGIRPGIPVALWLSTHGAYHPAIAERLRTPGPSS